LADATDIYLGIFASASDTDMFTLYHAGTVATDPFRCYTKTANDSINGGTAGAWHHGGGVYDATDSRTVYLNGTAGAGNAGDETPAGLDRIGIAHEYRLNARRYADGRVFWCAMWSGVLTATDMGRLSNGAEPVFVRRDVLKFFGRLMADEDVDIIGGGALVPVNSPTVSNDFPTTIIRALPRGRGRDRHRFT
jgi:hypothetical protein